MKNGIELSVVASAHVVERVLARLGIEAATLVIHGYGGIVGRELLDRRSWSLLPFSIEAVHVLNSGIVYDAYRPTRMQRLLVTPVLGAIPAKSLTERRIRAGLDAVRCREAGRCDLRRALDRDGARRGP